jgi:hypothetical protein
MAVPYTGLLPVLDPKEIPVFVFVVIGNLAGR